MDRKPLEQLKAVGKYDPSKNYVWDEKDLFTVTGAEIDAWNKAMALMVNTPEFQRFVHIQKGAILMQEFIKESVNQGLIVEKVDEISVKENKLVKAEDNGQPIEVNG